jgi:hypothetical protein
VGYSTETDKVIFSGGGLTASNAIVTRVVGTYDLKIAFSGTTDSVVLKDQLFGGLSNSWGIESVEFSDGTRWAESQL